MSICEQVAQARMEANDNIVYLKPLVGYFSKLQDEFSELIPVFRPTLHTLLLIWKNSKFYNTPARFVVIMRELCNTIIFQVLALSLSLSLSLPPSLSFCVHSVCPYDI